jgi:hypothetical protein
MKRPEPVRAGVAPTSSRLTFWRQNAIHNQTARRFKFVSARSHSLSYLSLRVGLLFTPHTGACKLPSVARSQILYS